MKNIRPNFYWKKIHNSHVAIMEGTPIYNQLWISVSSPHNTESVKEIIEEIEQVLNGNLVQTDFSSGETSDFVLVLKDESRLYPVFGEETHLKTPTIDLLEALKEWKEFISNPPTENQSIT